jgi:hypothetical protein
MSTSTEPTWEGGLSMSHLKADKLTLERCESPHTVFIPPFPVCSLDSFVECSKV